MQKCHYDVSSKVCKQTKLLYRTYPHIKQIIPAKWMVSSIAEQSIFKGGVVGFISLRFNGHFSRWTWVSRCLLKQRMIDGGGSDNWSYKTCKAPVKSSPSTNQHPVFTGPSCRPTNSVKAMKRKISHSMDLLTPSSPGVFQLCLWPLQWGLMSTKRSWRDINGGWVGMDQQFLYAVYLKCSLI